MQSLNSLIEQTVSGLGYELVDAEMASSGMLRVYIDNLPSDLKPTTESPGHVADGDVELSDVAPSDDVTVRDEAAPNEPAMIVIEDCERVSRQLTEVLAVENVNYDRLEVSSPGLDRPLTTEQHYLRFVGEEISLKLRVSFNNRRRYSGVLTAEVDGKFGLELIEESEPSGKSAKATAKNNRRRAKSGASQETVRVFTGQKMVFSLDEVERARLVPKVEFRRQA